MLDGPCKWLAAALLTAPVLHGAVAQAEASEPEAIETRIDRTFPVSREADVHAAPSGSSPVIGRLRSGLDILVVGVLPGHTWLQVKLPDGRTVGYLQTNAVPALANTSAAPDPGTITGHPIVRDTGTLVLAGRDLPLLGVQGEGGEYADALQRFISANGGTVTCRPQGDTRYVCWLPDNTDLAMVALLNGAARMTADAPDSYQAQQAEAQRGKKGIWAE